MTLTALIDADIYAFKAASSVEVETNWGDDLWTLHSDAKEAARAFDNMIENIVDELGADKVVVCLTDKDNFRKSVLPSYKHNRKSTRKPVCYKALLEYIKENYETFQRPTLEADDVLGILATSDKIIKGDKVVVTEDKDLQTIPCQLYLTSPLMKDKGVFTITEDKADKYHLQQTLSGDVTDGYSGCPGIGTATAEAIMSAPYKWNQYEHTFKSGKRKGETEMKWEKVDCDDLWECIVSHFIKAGLSERSAIQQARVARICRASDYNFKKKEVILWKPNS